MQKKDREKIVIHENWCTSFIWVPVHIAYHILQL